MNSAFLHRAHILIEQNRFEEAEKQVKQHLESEPDDTEGLRLLALCLAYQEKFEDAIGASRKAVASDPADDTVLFTHGWILYLLDKMEKAEKFIREAIKIDPFVAEYFATLADIKFHQKDFEAACSLSEKGLTINPRNITCMNIRTRALVKLGRKEDAYATLETALEQDPENPSTHANKGWSLLEHGKHQEALEHFREALRLDPHHSYAKAGLVEALKANYFIYRMFLKYHFWMSNLDSKMQWGVVIGAYILFKLLSSLAQENESLQPFIYPVLGVYVLFAFSSWVMNPIFNLMLRLNVYGRHALDEEETQSANLTGIALLTGIIALLIFLVFPVKGFLFLGIVGISLMIPIGSMFNPRSQTAKRNLKWFTLGLVGLGLLSVAGAFYEVETIGIPLLIAYGLGVFVYGWVANALSIK